MDTSFTGQADYTLDAKNRLTVPARYRGALEGGLVLAKDIEPCVAIWPTAGYDEFRRAALQDVHPMSQRGRKIMTFLSANSTPARSTPPAACRSSRSCWTTASSPTAT